MSAPTFNLADLWELVADAVPDRIALVCEERRISFGDLDERASRLAAWLGERGASRGSAIGMQMTNRVEHVESMIAAFKLRAMPVNVNYRLTEPELRSLYTGAGLLGVIHDEDLTPTVEGASLASNVAWTLSTGSGYEEIARTHATKPRTARSGDDLYVLYTGGTTGDPKGVEWRSEDAFFACIGGGDPRSDRGPVSRPEQIVERILPGVVFLPAPPLIHAAGMWTTLRWLLAGATVVLLPTFDARSVAQAVSQENVTVMNIVGDVMAVRLAEALEAQPGLDLSSLSVIGSGGAPLSPVPRARLLARLPQVTLKDSYGSSETGVHGWSVHTNDDPLGPRFRTVDTVLVDPEHSRTLLPAGSPETGLVARAGRVPLRYHNDPAASAETFLEISGVRYAITGDLGILDADGMLTLLGRGSQSINSGGEKIFPEEVESTLREHPGVRDALVVGVPDPVWGQRVSAVLELAHGHELNDDEIRAHCRRSLAGYKVPKAFVVVPEVHRTPAGKPDYRWAMATATGQLYEATS